MIYCVGMTSTFWCLPGIVYCYRTETHWQALQCDKIRLLVYLSKINLQTGQ